ncbi:MAG: NAD-dependent epimerase/dehydratase family protein [Alphaproteobacteria bacterium]|nr:NAD-dependent epimerase/dehydratase family protein [Alphaproteobacteria bacterium]
MKSALVTGAYGYLGRYVSRALAREDIKVIGLGHGSWGQNEQSDWGVTDWHQANVTLEALSTLEGNIDAVFHCAGPSRHSESMTKPYEDYQGSVATTIAVLEFIRRHRPEAALVLPSSAAVYGVATEQPIKVTCPYSPLSPYGVHKIIAEDLCRSYGKYFGVRSAIVRLFSIYGIGLRKQLWWDSCVKFSNGVEEFIGTGNETRDWLSVEDAATLMIRGAEHADKNCPIANGGVGEASSIREVVTIIAEALGHSTDIKFDGTTRAGDPTDFKADISEALAWGWKPDHNWQDGVREFAQWYADGAPKSSWLLIYRSR